MVITFPFKSIQTELFGEIFRPIATIEIWSKQYVWIPVEMIVDTGADYSILPLWLAKKIGIDVTNDCVKTIIEGVGGSTNVFLLRGGMRVKLASDEYRVPVGFIESTNVPPLLGRLKFLEKLDIRFDKHVTYIQES